jgi:hypothetical protein
MWWESLTSFDCYLGQMVIVHTDDRRKIAITDATLVQ